MRVRDTSDPTPPQEPLDISMKNENKTMERQNSSAYLFNNLGDAEEAIRSIKSSGFDVKKLSLVGKGYHSEQRPAGFYSAGDRIRFWGGTGAFWGGIWGLLLAPGVFLVPGFGLIALAGPVVTAFVTALEGATVVGGLSALGAALTTTGIPHHRVAKYEAALKSDKYILMVNGSEEDVAYVHSTLANSKTWLRI